MLQDTKLGFVGSGVMAEAILNGLLAEQLVSAPNITCADPLPTRLETLAEQYGVRTTTENTTAVDGADIVVLSIKPQALGDVMHDIRKHVRGEQLVLSIIAGVTTETLCKGLEHEAVVRVMPNTPAQLGEGMSVWTCTAAVSESDRQKARRILQALGEEVYVSREGELDMATALSGTGPAYVFLFMEALVDAGVHMGFSRRIAEQLVLQTVKGSVDYALKSPRHLAELRNQVTSPGGTTADALYHLEKGGMRTVISKAVFAAYKKSQYLSRLIEED
ncbi:MAG: pyrroline-5-carboxylate reductase [Vulcanimicrobiota bacterium]